jgi:hypothetical protein
MTSTTVASSVLLALVATAHAQAPSASELFKQGRELVKNGKHAEACEKFRKSQELDPQLGTLFNIAQCDEKTGKLATALAEYREVVAKDTNGKRKATAAEYQSKLEPRVPKLVVQIAKPPQSLVVTLDGPTGGKPIDANLPIEVDFGDYTVIARADGYRELSAKVKIDKEGDTTTVPVALALVHAETQVSHAEQQPKPVEEVHTAVEPSHSHRKTYGKIALIGGGAVLAAGAVFGVLANGKWSDAKNVCGGTTCPTQPQVDMAEALVNDARSDGNISTALVIGGAAIAGVGLALWLTAPSDEHAVHVTVTAHGAAIAGRF